MAQGSVLIDVIEEKLNIQCNKYKRDPWGFVQWAFPWEEDGPLKDHEPEAWQRDTLKRIRDRLNSVDREGDWSLVIREAVASGHGPGKSTLIAWLLAWGLSTMADTRAVVTANTEPQLRTKTLPEIRKWFGMCKTGHWFTVTATAVFSVHRNLEKTWRADLIPWSEHRPESFAGLHNEGRRILFLFDEASAIADSIWETTEGGLTDRRTEIIFCVFGNPTRRDGHFARIFRNLRHRWNVCHVDARDARLTNKELLGQWIEDYGLESNFVKVRILGLFPDEDQDQLIPESWVRKALELDLTWDEEDEGALVCDVARGGPDETVIGWRRGPVYRELERYQGKDLTKTYDILMGYWHKGQREDTEMSVVYITIDDTGLGGGVTDFLELAEVDVRPFVGAETAYENTRFRNKRDEGWWHLREEFRLEQISLVDIDEEEELVRQLTMLECDYTGDRTMIETKKQAIKRTKLSSPDRGDAMMMAYWGENLAVVL